jgi:hypothetical protein
MKFSTILFTFCLVPALLHTAMGQGFSVSPSRITFTGNPGETVSQSVTFSNNSPNALSFINRIQDWDRDSLGNKVYYDSNTRPLSNGKWISLSANSVMIKPGEVKQVIVSLNIPADAKKLTHSMIFFTQVKEQQTEQVKGTAIGISVLMEVGVQVYYDPKGLNSGEFEFLAFEDRGVVVDPKGASVRRLALKIHNKGAINKDATLRFELTNKDTGEETKFGSEIIAMLPDATQWVMLDLPVTLKGNFLAVALLDAGSTYDLKVAEKEITYRP